MFHYIPSVTVTDTHAGATCCVVALRLLTVRLCFQPYISIKHKTADGKW